MSGYAFRHASTYGIETWHEDREWSPEVHVCGSYFSKYHLIKDQCYQEINLLEKLHGYQFGGNNT